MATDLAYKERARCQCLSWAMGNSYHNKIDNECAPDFSCCNPELYEQDDAKRWSQYHKEYGRIN
jgi:hypothetical protein